MSAVVAADHAEALQMNAEVTPKAIDAAHDDAHLANMGIEFYNRVRLYPETVISPEEAHTEALIENGVRTESAMQQYHLNAMMDPNGEDPHDEALAEDSELHANHYTYVKPYASSLVFKTDGRRVWWWSFNRGVWFPDFNVAPGVVHNHVSSGNGEYCSNPEK